MATVASHSDMAQFAPEYSTQFLGELQGILEKAQRFSGASGVAIAFVEGEELVTKSGLGASAPEVGSRSPIQGSFTGLSVQTREVQRCDDASHDTRVDGHACASLGIASMVIVPIGEKSKALGVLAAFASKPNAFTPTHVALLRTLADIVVELYHRFPPTNGAAAGASTVTAPKTESKPAVPAKPEVPKTVTPAAAAPKITVPPASPKVESAPRIPEPPKVKPVSTSPSAIKLTEAPVIVPPVTAEPRKEARAKQEPLRIERKIEAPRYAPVVDIDAGRERREEVLSSAADIGPVTVSRGISEPPAFSGYAPSSITAYEQRERDETGSKRVLMIAAALVVVAALGAGGYFFTHKSAKGNETAKLTQPQPTAPASVPSSTQPAETPGNTTSASVAPPVEKAPEHLEKAAPAKEHAAEPAAPKKPEHTPEHAPIMVAGGGNIPKGVAGESVEAPGVIPAGNGDVSGILGMVKTAQPRAAFKSSSVTPPELMKRVPPIYPAFARQWHLKSERVVLNATIGKDGTVTDVKLVRGKQIFVDSAMTAVKQWKYKPAYLNGDPVPASIEVVLDFTN